MSSQLGRRARLTHGKNIGESVTRSRGDPAGLEHESNSRPTQGAGPAIAAKCHALVGSSFTVCIL